MRALDPPRLSHFWSSHHCFMGSCCLYPAFVFSGEGALYHLFFTRTSVPGSQIVDGPAVSRS